MSNLARFETKSGIELVIDQQTGEAFATVSGYARMSGKNKSTISRRMKTVAEKARKTTEIQTTQGLRTVALIPAELVFEWTMKDKPELAKEMGACGATVYLHHLAGYKIESKPDLAPQTPQTYLEALKALVAAEEEKERLRRETEALSEENKELMGEVEELAEVCDELFDYSSIIRIAKFNHISETEFNWRILKKISTALNLEIKKVPCPRFVSKNLYHHRVWLAAYPWAKLPEITHLTVYQEPDVD